MGGFDSIVVPPFFSVEKECRAHLSAGVEMREATTTALAGDDDGRQASEQRGVVQGVVTRVGPCLLQCF